MSLVRDPAELPAALDRIFASGDAALIEEGLTGQELTCAVLGDEPLPPILIRPKAGEFFDYASKYEPGAADEICPAPVDAGLIRELGEATCAAHKTLGLDGYSRADFIYGPSGLMLLEVNTLPGMAVQPAVGAPGRRQMWKKMQEPAPGSVSGALLFTSRP